MPLFDIGEGWKRAGATDEQLQRAEREAEELLTAYAEAESSAEQLLRLAVMLHQTALLAAIASRSHTPRGVLELAFQDAIDDQEYWWRIGILRDGRR